MVNQMCGQDSSIKREEGRLSQVGDEGRTLADLFSQNLAWRGTVPRAAPRNCVCAVLSSWSPSDQPQAFSKEAFASVTADPERGWVAREERCLGNTTT